VYLFVLISVTLKEKIRNLIVLLINHGLEHRHNHRSE